MRDAHRLTLEQKVGQLFILGFQGYQPDQETSALFDYLQPGGFHLFQRNIESFPDPLHAGTGRHGDGAAAAWRPRHRRGTGSGRI